MTEYSKETGGILHLLTCIDVFSEYAWVQCLPMTKSGDAVTNSFGVSEERVPKNIQTDAGKEFYNKKFQYLMRQKLAL